MMQIVIDIPEQMYLNAKANTLCGGDIIVKAIKNGAPLPDGVEILTKEAYSDLCMSAAEQPEKRTEKRTETHACDYIIRQAAEEKLKKVVDEMALIFADIREKNVDDSVCGLCEYDCDHGLDGCANECPGFERDDCFKLKEEYQKEWTDLSDIPSVDPERKPGKWLLKIEDWNRWTCSECGFSTRTDIHVTLGYDYCPKCGAQMEVDG